MKHDVIIVGSGLVGASLALALAGSGLRIAVVEARPPVMDAAEWDSRIYAISPGNAAYLGQCGIWEGLDAARICQVEEMRVFGDDQRSELDFSAYDAGLRELAFIVENRSLQLAMWDALGRHADMERIAPVACRELALDDNEARLTLEDGRELNTALLVAADGADSWVRAQAGIKADVQPYPQTAVVANFSCAQPHNGTAYQWFYPGSVLALLPLPGERVSMVWSVPTAEAEELLQLPPQDLAARVADAAHGMVGELQVITPPAGFPLRLQRVSRLVQPRLALIGDAAHTVHPLAGQGVNLGFRDARELARVLTGRGPQADCGDYFLLRRYERARREDIATTALTSDTLQRLFSGGNAPLDGLRNFGLGAVNHLGGLKNLLIQHAVG